MATDRMDIGAGFGYTALPEKEAQFSALEVGLNMLLFLICYQPQ